LVVWVNALNSVWRSWSWHYAWSTVSVIFTKYILGLDCHHIFWWLNFMWTLLFLMTAGEIEPRLHKSSA